MSNLRVGPTSSANCSPFHLFAGVYSTQHTNQEVHKNLLRLQDSKDDPLAFRRPPFLSIKSVLLCTQVLHQGKTAMCKWKISSALGAAFRRLSAIANEGDRAFQKIEALRSPRQFGKFQGTAWNQCHWICLRQELWRQSFSKWLLYSMQAQLLLSEILLGP